MEQVEVSELEDNIDIQSEKNKKNEESLHVLRDTIERYNLQIMEVPGRREGDSLFKEIIAENSTSGEITIYPSS